jgi:hypothetical protein
MEFLPRQFLLGVCAIALAIGLADALHGETAPAVVGLARCSDCTRKNTNAEAAFKGTVRHAQTINLLVKNSITKVVVDPHWYFINSILIIIRHSLQIPTLIRN